jgi:hypothetical protein
VPVEDSLISHVAQLIIVHLAGQRLPQLRQIQGCHLAERRAARGLTTGASCGALSRLSPNTFPPTADCSEKVTSIISNNIC